MNNIFYFAQKAIVLDETKTKILLVYYSDSKFTPEKVKGRYGLPGGRMEFGEELDEAFRREVLEETGIQVSSGKVIDLITWKYQKKDTNVQIVAAIRLGFYVSGIAKLNFTEEEVNIAKVVWKDLAELKEEEIILDEWPSIQKFLKLKHEDYFL